MSKEPSKPSFDTKQGMVVPGRELTGHFVRIVAVEARKYLSNEGQACPSFGEGRHSGE